MPVHDASYQRAQLCVFRHSSQVVERGVLDRQAGRGDTHVATVDRDGGARCQGTVHIELPGVHPRGDGGGVDVGGRVVQGPAGDLLAAGQDRSLPGRGLPQGPGFRPREKGPELIHGNRAVIVDKDTRSVAFSIGFPIGVTRRNPDYPALLLAASYFGQHRMPGGVLYDEMREKRGLNYGDYSYVEYFPRGMFLMEPPQKPIGGD